MTDTVNNIIADVILTIKAEGTHIKAFQRYGKKIKKFTRSYQVSQTVSQLIEEGDNAVFNFLRIIHVCDPSWIERRELIFRKHTNSLEKAIIPKHWNIANFLVKFALESDSKQLEKDEFWDSKLEHKATPDQWGKAIKLVVKSCIPSDVHYGISNLTVGHLWVKRLSHMKSVIHDGFVTILDLVKYPTAFMLMIVLGVYEVPQKTVYNVTLPYAVWRSGAKKEQRAMLLQFLFEAMDPNQFDLPCGPNNVPLVYEILRAADLYILERVHLLRTKIDWNMKDEKDRNIGYYIHPTLMFNEIFQAQDRLVYGHTAIHKNTPAIVNFLDQREWIADHYFERYPEILQALDVLLQKDKEALLSHLETTGDLFLLAYCMSKGHKAPQKNNTWNELYEVWALNNKKMEKLTDADDSGINGADLRCHIYELPDEIIVSTTMHQLFKRMTSSSLWREIATKYFNAHKLNYLASQPITDWRSHVIKEMRWRKNWIHQRFTERTVFTEPDGKSKGNVCFAVDDNWFVNTSELKVCCWNCHTGQTESMHLSRVNLNNIIIVESTPNSLKIAIIGVSRNNGGIIVIIADPLANRVLKEIQPRVPADRAIPYFFKYQSKLCYYIGPELQEVDIEAGTTKVIKDIPKESVKSIAVNSENNSLLLNRPSVKTNFMLDADMNLIELERAPATQHILDKAFRTTNSHLIPVINMLEFGQWFASVNDSPIYQSLIDNQNSRVLIKKGSAGISMLLHPNLKTWYAAWSDAPQKFVAMNSRYLF